MKSATTQFGTNTFYCRIMIVRLFVTSLIVDCPDLRHFLLNNYMDIQLYVKFYISPVFKGIVACILPI